MLGIYNSINDFPLMLIPAACEELSCVHCTEEDVTKWSKLSNYCVHNSLWQMQSLSFIVIFNTYFLVVHKPFDPISEETSLCDLSQLCTEFWTSLSLEYLRKQKAPFCNETCCNPMKLGPKYTGRGRALVEIANFSYLIVSIITAAQFGRAFSLTKRTFLDNKPPRSVCYKVQMI